MSASMTQRLIRLGLIVLAIVSGGDVHGGSVFYVDVNALPGGDGTTWESAFNELTEALMAADSNGDGQADKVDAFWVAEGIYTPTFEFSNGDPESVSFWLLNSLSILGGFAGDETQEDQRDPLINLTVLTGELGIPNDPTDNAWVILRAISSTDSTAVLDGFTLRDGYAVGGNERGGAANLQGGDPIFLTCRFVDNFAIHSGGAVWGTGSPSFIDCTFVNNETVLETGGAIRCSGLLTLTSCDFTGNIGGAGGAVWAQQLSMIDCVFEDNESGASGGAVIGALTLNAANCLFVNNHSIFGDGGALTSAADSVVLIDCTFVGNTAFDDGGAINFQSVDDTVTLIGCRFVGNSADRGGALIDQSAQLSIINCTFSGNFSATDGGAVACMNALETLVINSTFSANIAAQHGGGIFIESPLADVTNTILWDNLDIDGIGESSQLQSTGNLSVNYSLIQGLTGGLGGDGNIDQDPLFVDPDGPDFTIGTADDDLRLLPGSPCIDAADNTALPTDEFDLDEDMDTDELIPFDGYGMPRRVDDPDSFDTGNGIPPIVDIGSYEFDGSTDEPKEPGLFIGKPGGSWFDPENWAGGRVPDDQTNVIIPTTVVVDQAGAIANIVQVLDGGNLIISAGSINALAFIIEFGGVLTLDDGVALVETSSLAIEPTATLQWNSGTIHIFADGSLSSFAPLEVGCEGMAVLLMDPGATITSSTVQICAMGEITGSGAIIGNVENAGALTVDASTGGLQVDGDYIQMSSGTLELMLAGYLPGMNHDPVAIADDATLAGVLNVTLLPEFNPELANRQTVLSAADFIGGFEVTNLASLPGSFVFELQSSLLDKPQLLWLLTTLTSTGPRLYVNADAPVGGDAQSWETATNDLQGALQLAPWFPDDISEVWVAAGAYRPDRRTGDRTTSFNLPIDALAVYGGFAGGETMLEQRDIEVNVTVLTGDLAENDGPDFENNGENSYHVVLINQQGQQQRLDGFTISGGNANDPDDLFNRNGGGLRNNANDLTVSQCRFVGNFATNRAGGMSDGGHFTVVSNCEFIENRCPSQGGAFSPGSDVNVIDTIFESNESGEGGAVFVGSGVDPVFTGCMFRTNIGGNGSGLFVDDTANPSNVTLVDCVFEGNSSTGSAVDLKVGNSLSATGCLFADNSGGGIRSISSLVSLDNCILIGTTGAAGVQVSGSSQEVVLLASNSSFIDNTSSGLGGGVYIGSGVAVVHACAFVGNSSVTDGGGIYVQSQASLQLAGSTLIGNVAERGGGLFNGSATNSVITNCTLYLNQALVEGGGIFNDPTSSVVANSILWNNFDPGGTDESAQIHGGTPFVNFTCIQGLTGDLGGFGNIGDDPLFVDPDGADNVPGNLDDNLRLQIESPCIDAAFNNAVQADLADVDNDDDLVEFMPLDLDGNPRFADAPSAPDTGCGVPVIVDMGAYEFLGEAVQPRRGDTNGDLIVGASDLLHLLSSWGPCSGCCLADFNADGIVSAEDLLILLVNWG